MDCFMILYNNIMKTFQRLLLKDGGVKNYIGHNSRLAAKL